MRLPSICLDDQLAKYLAQFRACFSQPQYKYFVTILLGLLLSQSGFTLSGILRQVSADVTLSGMSRFLSEAPWSTTEVCQQWQTAFQAEMTVMVEAEHARQRAKQAKQPGRPRKTVVTGYLIGDDSVMQKRRGQKMGGIGHHFSSTAEKTVQGHCLVQALYVLLGRQCVLEPQMYRQQTVCEAAGEPFVSKVEMMMNIIRTFVPVPDTQTHVLLDSWFTAKKLWQVVRERDFLITCGIRSNRSLRVADPSSEKGWHWQTLHAYGAQLSPDDFTLVSWPRGDRQVYVHVVQTRIKKLYTCQLICIREKLEGNTKFWVSNDLEADVVALLGHIAQRWDIEVLFADVKELLGIDQYQLMSVQAIQRFWLLVMVAYGYLEKERHRLQRERGCQTSIGDACRHVQRVHWCHLLDWLYDRFTSHHLSVADLQDMLLV
jgi:DDE superfamily endonuclease